MELDPEHTAALKSGKLLAGYLLILKERLEHEYGKKFGIKTGNVGLVANSSSHYTDIKTNWVVLITQLLAANFQIDSELKTQCLLGNTTAVRQLFDKVDSFAIRVIL